MTLVEYDHKKIRQYFIKNIMPNYPAWDPDKDGEELPMVKWLRDIGAKFVVKEVNEMGEATSHQLQFEDEADAVVFKLMIG
jgi:hypothetical protein